MLKRAIFLTFLLVSLSAAAQDATLILTNGRIFTGDGFVEALAVSGEKITAVGTSADIAKLKRAKTTVIDLEGRTAIPGINDAHTHPGDALNAFRMELPFDANLEQLQAALASAADETPADMPILGTLGPALVNNRSIDKAMLDKIAPRHRVFLTSFTGHGLVMNSAAMNMLGVTGVADGRVVEYAQYPIDRKLYETATDAELRDTLANFGQELVAHGITSIQAMPLVSEDRFLAAWKRAGVPVRLRLIEFVMSPKDPITAGPDGIKYILDGTPLEHGAALRTAHYSDNSQGKLNFADLKPLIETATKTRQPLLFHAAGDAAVAQVLDALEKMPVPPPRTRIEHGDGLQRDLIPRAQRLGIVVVQNPTHFPFGNTYPSGDYQLAKTLVDAKIPFAFGSDGPLNPYLNIMEAVDRQNDAEELSREQAVVAYTAGSAYAEFREKEKGKLLPGFLADIAVLSRDIFKSRLAELPDTHSEMTIIGGKIVHREFWPAAAEPRTAQSQPPSTN